MMAFPAAGNSPVRDDEREEAEVMLGKSAPRDGPQTRDPGGAHPVGDWARICGGPPRSRVVKGKYGLGVKDIPDVSFD